MRKTIAVYLFALACTKSERTVEQPPLADSYDNLPSANTASREEGHLRLRSTDSDPQLARQQAIEAARSSGVLGNASGTAFAAIAATALYDGTSPWTVAAKDHLSTFAADVDTASYTHARRTLHDGGLPSSVRSEEFVNYFAYAFPAPTGPTPFSVVIDAAPSPLQPGRHILRVGVATAPKPAAQRKPVHLVFLVDVSGSMDEPDKLPLAKQALHVLTDHLRDGDTVSLVTYAGTTELVLQPTGVAHKAEIDRAIDKLSADGTTNMASGIDIAYRQALAGVAPGVTSRVIICTDGDANVGARDPNELLGVIAGRAREGVTLSTIGFGNDNYQDSALEQLADQGNGNNFYIDSLAAAQRVFGDQLTATLEVAAKDVKLQVNFDPALVARYRLVGYDDRGVADSDFRNDHVAAGQVGVGHQVTALYDVELTARGEEAHTPFASLRIRYMRPTGGPATEATFPMVGGSGPSFSQASADFRFAFAVAAFAEALNGGSGALAPIRELANAATGKAEDRVELVGLIDRAIELRGAQRARGAN